MVGLQYQVDLPFFLLEPGENLWSLTGSAPWTTPGISGPPRCGCDALPLWIRGDRFATVGSNVVESSTCSKVI